MVDLPQVVDVNACSSTADGSIVPTCDICCRLRSGTPNSFLVRRADLDSSVLNGCLGCGLISKILVSHVPEEYSNCDAIHLQNLGFLDAKPRFTVALNNRISWPDRGGIEIFHTESLSLIDNTCDNH